MSVIIQRNFAGGEIAPALYARTDQVKYATGLRTLRNMYVARHGGAYSRPGSLWVGEVKESSKRRTRLIPFIYSKTATFMLEFGHLYMRVIHNGSQAVASISRANFAAGDTITNANPAVVTVAGHGYSNGDELKIYGIRTGMTELNNRSFLVANATANTFELQDLNGVGVNSTNYGTYDLVTGAGLRARTGRAITAITKGTPTTVTATTTGLANGDEVYISRAKGMTEINGRNFKVTNVTGTTFDLQYLDGTTVDSASWGTYTSGGAAYEIFTLTTTITTAMLDDLQYAQCEENMFLFHRDMRPKALTLGASTTNPYEDDWAITNITSRIEITAVDNASTSGASGGGGDPSFSWFVTAVERKSLDESLIDAGATTTANNNFSTNSVTVTWDAHTDPDLAYYNIYRQRNGTLATQRGRIGSTQETSFVDANITPDISKQPGGVTSLFPFTSTDTHPAVGCFYQQRLCVGNTYTDPQGVWASKINNFRNFLISFPLQTHEGVQFSLLDRERVSQIHGMVDLGKLVVFTSDGEHVIEGDESGALKHASINARLHSSHGSKLLRPIVIGKSAIFVQAEGKTVRDLGFDVQSPGGSLGGGYQGNDLTTFAAHLFDLYTINDWAYQQIPHSLVHCVRSDGKLVTLTYLREHQIWGWHHHDTDGNYESIASIPEGNETAVYVIVKRTIDGATKRFIERFTTRQINDIKDYVAVDAALSYDGSNTNTNHTMTLSGGSDWDHLENLTLTSSHSFFASTDVGNEIQLYITDDDGAITDTVRCRIHQFTSVTVVTVKPHKTVPVALRSTATDDWAKAVDELSGLWHLEDKQVSVFADGFVVASPNNASYTTVTVTNGAITLDKPYAVIHVGLPYTCDLETLDIDTVSGETMASRKKLVSKVSMHVEDSRGIWVGAKPPSDDDEDPLEDLTEVKLRNDEGYDDPVSLHTKVVDVNIKSEWNSNGRLFIRQVDPVPMAIASVIPEGLLPLGR